MKLSAKTIYVALIISFVLTVASAVFMYFFTEIPLPLLMAWSAVFFVAGYFIIHGAMDYFIRRHISIINNRLNRLKEGDLSFAGKPDKDLSGKYLEEINRDLLVFAEQKQKEIEELKKTVAYRREFIADISHELKTPIFAAQGFVHTLLDGAIKDKNVRNKFLKKAAKSLDGLDRLVQDLLTISKMETGEMKMEFEHFNLYELIEEAFEQFESKAEKRDMKLTFDERCEKDLYVYADSQKIYQVITNLISNAISYKKEGEGLLKVNIFQMGNMVEVSFTDFGVGISGKDMKRIFERFYRVDKSRSKESGGSGLGLSIVKHILEAHQTSIRVHSKVGEYTQFLFRLPLGEKQ